MNTTGFVPRDYYQIFESLRILFTGGNKQDFIYYPINEYKYELKKNNIRIGMIQGVVNNKSHTFQEGKDFHKDISESSKATIKWENGIKPDSGSTFSVYYYESEVDIDMQVGSVARTLLEAISWEMSFAYTQMDFIHQASFLETSTEKSLDNIAEMLGVYRVGGENQSYWEAQVTFISNNPVQGQIKIDKGTLLKTSGENGEEFITTEDTLITIGTTASSPVFVRSIKNTSTMDKKPEGKISIIPLPIEGVNNVEHRGEIYKKNLSSESDVSLRERCKQKLAGIGKCTENGIKYELMKRGVEEVKVNNQFPLQVICYSENVNILEEKKEEKFKKKSISEKEEKPKQEKTFREKIEEAFQTDIKAAGVEGKIEWAQKIEVSCTITPTKVKNTKLFYGEVYHLEEMERIWENTINTIFIEHFEQYYKMNKELDKQYKPLTSNLYSKLKYNNDFIMEDFLIVYSPLIEKQESNFKYILKQCSLKKCNRITITITVTGKSNSEEFLITEEGFSNYFDKRKMDLAKELYEWISIEGKISKASIKEKVQNFLQRYSIDYELQAICLQQEDRNIYIHWQCSIEHKEHKDEKENIVIENPQWSHISIVSKYNPTN